MKYVPGVALLVVALALAVPARADHARFGPVLTIDAEYARALMERGGVAPIDLRSEDDFRAGRLPGARSLPLSALTSRVDELPRAGIIILYGEGPIERLFGAYHYIRARRAGELYMLEGGLESWRQLGYQLER
jgi:rhodanese-related sulfurtransferase